MMTGMTAGRLDVRLLLATSVRSRRAEGEIFGKSGKCPGLPDTWRMYICTRLQFGKLSFFRGTSMLEFKFVKGYNSVAHF